MPLRMFSKHLHRWLMLLLTLGLMSLFLLRLIPLLTLVMRGQLWVMSGCFLLLMCLIVRWYRQCDRLTTYIGVMLSGLVALGLVGEPDMLSALCATACLLIVQIVAESQWRKPLRYGLVGLFVILMLVCAHMTDSFFNDYPINILIHDMVFASPWQSHHFLPRFYLFVLACPALIVIGDVLISQISRVQFRIQQHTRDIGTLVLIIVLMVLVPQVARGLTMGLSLVFIRLGNTTLRWTQPNTPIMSPFTRFAFLIPMGIWVYCSVFVLFV